MSDADGVRDLHEHALAQAGLDQRLGHPASGVRSAAVHFGVVLAREGTATVSAPAAIRIDDDLASGKAGVALRSADDERAARIQVIDGVLVEVLGGHHLLHHVLHEVLADLLERHVRRVLHRDDHGVHAQRHARAVADHVLDGHLGLGVRSGPGEHARATQIGDLAVELVREHNGERHALLGLVRGVAEHEALVAGADVLLLLVDVHRLGDVRTLLLDGEQDVARLEVEALVGRVVADLLDRVADHLLVVDARLRRDLAADQDHAGLGVRLCSYQLNQPRLVALDRSTHTKPFGHKR